MYQTKEDFLLEGDELQELLNESTVNGRLGPEELVQFAIKVSSNQIAKYHDWLLENYDLVRKTK